MAVWVLQRSNETLQGSSSSSSSTDSNSSRTTDFAELSIRTGHVACLFDDVTLYLLRCLTLGTAAAGRSAAGNSRFVRGPARPRCSSAGFIVCVLLQLCDFSCKIQSLGVWTRQTWAVRSWNW
jgi:hypothetical protein